MPINQKGNFIPILGLVALLIVLGGAYYLRTSTNRATEPEIVNTPKNPSVNKTLGADCKPSIREFEGRCTLGQITVQTKRTLKKEELQLLLDKHDLTVLYDWGNENVILDIRRLDKEFTSAQWQEKLNDPVVSKVQIWDTAYTDGTYSGGLVSFIPDITDQQIDNYIQKKGIDKADFNISGTENAYIVKVPDGTESDWREKLMNDSKDITDVRLTYNSFSVPL